MIQSAFSERSVRPTHSLDVARWCVGRTLRLLYSYSHLNATLLEIPESHVVLICLQPIF